MAENSFSIDTLLEQMVAHNASDLHITVGSQPALRVRGQFHRDAVQVPQCLSLRSIASAHGLPDIRGRPIWQLGVSASTASVRTTPYRRT